jgi:hypothetical protein
MNCINPTEPPSMDIEKIKREYGVRVALWGNIDLVRTLPHSTIEEVEVEVKERICRNGFKAIKNLPLLPEYMASVFKNNQNPVKSNRVLLAYIIF